MANQNCRYLNLLNKLGLENRIFNRSKGSLKEQMDSHIDWGSVNQKREEFIKDSETYLINSIENE